MVVIGSRPPKLQRRGLHAVHGAVLGAVRELAEAIWQVHRERGAHPHALFSVVNNDIGESRLMATV